MQSLLHVPNQYNPTARGLTPYGAQMLQSAPLIAIGTLDNDGRPWTTLLGGQPGFARSIGNSVIGAKTLVDTRHDPVVDLLVGDQQDGEVKEQKGNGRIFSALSINLATRSRVKITGRMIAGALRKVGSKPESNDYGIGEAQLVFNVEQSLGKRIALSMFSTKLNNSTGNCPKYLNKKQITASLPEPTLASNSLPLPDLAVTLLAKADLFFLSSSCHESNMGTNHRGGPPGFVRIVKNDASGTTLAYPEYSGNRLYQTLGNLQITPKAGLVVPDFASGNVLYMTGTTEIVIGNEAATLLARSNLAVKVNIDAARFVRKGLAFRGASGEFSPYNPPVRFLGSERALFESHASNGDIAYARLVKKDLITPTIARFRFSVSDGNLNGRWKPGQYVALAFEDEVGAGYSHMRNDDPRSLNDDYVRTFTVSSPPGGILTPNEFEITIRNVGVVTNFLFRQQVRAGLEVPLRGFGGDFAITQTKEETVSFIAGGIGITPLLSRIPPLDPGFLRLLWTINIRDIGLVSDIFNRYPSLAASTTLFVSGAVHAATEETKTVLESVKLLGCKTLTRRILPQDVQEGRDLYSRWYICTGTELRKVLLSWLPDEKVLYEDFNY